MELPAETASLTDIFGEDQDGWTCGLDQSPSTTEDSSQSPDRKVPETARPSPSVSTVGGATGLPPPAPTPQPPRTAVSHRLARSQRRYALARL